MFRRDHGAKGGGAKGGGARRSNQRLIRFALALAAVVLLACVRLYYVYGWWLALTLRLDDPHAPGECSVAAAAASPNKKAPRVALLAIVDSNGASTARYADVARFSAAAEANKAAYTEARGYGFVRAKVEADPQRPAPWFKLVAIREALKKYDWVMYVDGDALIVDPSVRLECSGFLDDGYDLVMTEDWGGLNTGVFLVRNSTFSRWLLETMWQTALEPHNLAKQNKWYKHELPFEYEQRSLHFLTDSPTWRAAVAKYGIPQYKGGEYSAAEIRSRIKIVPQCAMNSYLVRPRLRSSEAHAAARYKPQDFIVHLAGHKAKNKAALFEFALKLAKPPRESSTPSQECPIGSRDAAAASPPPTQRRRRATSSR